MGHELKTNGALGMGATLGRIGCTVPMDAIVKLRRADMIDFRAWEQNCRETSKLWFITTQRPLSLSGPL